MAGGANAMLPLRSSTSVAYQAFGGGSNTGMDMVVELIGDGVGNGSIRSNVTTTNGSGPGRVSKSHSEAERRRRQRINAHLATLRSLLPNTTKMDKASLLTEVVRQVRELRRCAEDVAAFMGDTWNDSLPGEADEVRLDRVVEEAEGGGLMKASVCCEDRPGLLVDLNQAIRSVHGRAVRAEVATVGGRTKSVVLVEGEVEGEGRSTLHAALRAVSQKPGLVGSGLGENKRLRLSHHLPPIA